MMNNSTKEYSKFNCRFVDAYLFDYDISNHHVNLAIFLIIVNILFAIAATFTNMVVIISIIKNPTTRYPSNILILGLTLSDLGVGIIAQPLFCAVKILELNHETNNDIICYTSLSFNTVVWLLGTVSFLTLTSITADRFIALHLHLRYRSVVTIRRYTIVLVAIWTLCTAAVINKRLLGEYRVLQGMSILSCAVGFIVNGVFIYKIAKVVGRHSAQIQAFEQPSQSADINMPRYKKSVNTLYVIIAAFLLCYLPLAVTIVIHVVVQSREFIVYWGYFIAGTLAMANSSLNPVIYCWRNKDIRNAVFQLFQKSTAENSRA